MLRLLPLLLIAFLVAAAPAAAAAPRCAKHTVVIGPKKQPRACLPKTLPAANPIVLKSLVERASRTGVWSELVRRLFGARAAQADPGLPAGVKLVQNGDVMELRNKAGDSVSMGLEKANSVPSCPQANGDVPAKLDETMTFGAGTAEHGKRTWAVVTTRNEATWTGHVGVGAKAETFDVAFRGEVSIKSGVEIASTGKVLKRNPTRTYRSALTKKGVPVKFDLIALAKELTFRGPKGERGDAKDLDALTALVTTSMFGLSDIRSELEKGDTRWYDQRACAELDFNSTPEKVVKGGRADWNAWVNAAGRYARRRRALDADERLWRAQRRHPERRDGPDRRRRRRRRLGAVVRRGVRGRRDHVHGRSPAAARALDPAARSHPLPLRHRHRLQEGHGLGDRPDPRDGARTGDGRPG